LYDGGTDLVIFIDRLFLFFAYFQRIKQRLTMPLNRFLLRTLGSLLFLLTAFFSNAQDDQRLIIITTDGFRWQEVYNGMDAAVASDKRFNQYDSAGIFNAFWDQSPEARRQKLLPFFWGTIAKQGQLYGNRKYGNKIDNANPYWFSYPGYSEILTGHVDTLINSNEYPPNPHKTILEYYNSLPAYKGKEGSRFCCMGCI
jgi:hypothetical protein